MDLNISRDTMEQWCVDTCGIAESSNRVEYTANSGNTGCLCLLCYYIEDTFINMDCGKIVL